MASLENVDQSPLLEETKTTRKSHPSSAFNGSLNGEEFKTDTENKNAFDRLLTQDFKVTGDISNRAHEKLGGSFTTIDDFFQQQSQTKRPTLQTTMLAKQLQIQSTYIKGASKKKRYEGLRRLSQGSSLSGSNNQNRN